MAIKKTTDDIKALVRNPVLIVRAKIDVVVSVVQGLRGRASRVRTLLDDKEVRLVGSADCGRVYTAVAHR